MNVRTLVSRRAMAFLGLCALGCLHGEPRPGPNDGAWPAARDRWHRQATLYDGLSAEAFAKAVYQAPEVREARVGRVADWKVLSPAEREKLLAGERAEGARADEFLLSFFSVTRPENDLDTPGSIWRVALVVPGAPDRLPERIEAVKADATLKQLYPSIGAFDVVYRVRFPRAGEPPLEGGPFTLRLASARGRLELAWGEGR